MFQLDSILVLVATKRYSAALQGSGESTLLLECPTVRRPREFEAGHR